MIDLPCPCIENNLHGHTYLMDLEHILALSTEMGYQLLRCGADVSRTEISIQYLGAAYGVDAVHVLAIPSGLAVTMIKNEKSLSTSRKVTQSTNNLGMLESLSGLSRLLCEQTPGYKESLALLNRTLSAPGYPVFVRLLAQMAAGSSFCIFFGGTWMDALIALGIGAGIFSLRRFLELLHANGFFIQAILGFFSAAVGLTSSNWLPEIFHADTIIISGIILLVPGLSISNSIRDFLLNDIMTGITRFTESLLTALGIALGVTTALLFI